MLPVFTKRNQQLWSDPLEFARGYSAVSKMLDDGQWMSNYPVDIYEDVDNFYLDAELPGYRKDQINLTYENGILTIAAEMPKKDEGQWTVHLKERHWSRYERWFKLPGVVDGAKICAKLEDGVLHLVMPKKAEAKPQRIDLK